jgi:hypothetical protein
MFHRREFAKRGNPDAAEGFIPRTLHPSLRPMHRRDDRYERMCAENEAAELAARRAERRYWIVTLLVCWAWCGVGGAVTVYGFHIFDPVNGPILVDAGPLIAGAGTLTTVLIAAYRRREQGYE